MKRIFDTLKNLDTLTHIIIENQISPIANRMKTIQGLVEVISQYQCDFSIGTKSR